MQLKMQTLKYYNTVECQLSELIGTNGISDIQTNL